MCKCFYVSIVWDWIFKIVLPYFSWQKQFISDLNIKITNTLFEQESKAQGVSNRVRLSVALICKISLREHIRDSLRVRLRLLTPFKNAVFACYINELLRVNSIWFDLLTLWDRWVSSLYLLCVVVVLGVKSKARYYMVHDVRVKAER